MPISKQDNVKIKSEKKTFKDTLIEKKHIFEDNFEKFLFATRWILAPMYLLLIVVLVLIVIRFIGDVGEFIRVIASGALIEDNDWIVRVLELLDLTLVANLVLIIAFSGYENFISKIDAAQNHTDRLNWMGNLDFSGLKLKIIGSVVAISLIELLQDFLNMSYKLNPDVEFWRVVLHMVFLISAFLFAKMELLSGEKEEIKEKISEQKRFGEI